MNIQKQGRTLVNLFLFFSYSLNTLHPSQRSKGMCLDHNPRFIRFYNEMTMKRSKHSKKNG